MTTLVASGSLQVSAWFLAGPSSCMQAPNPSIELTYPGEPGHAAHVKR